MNLRLSAAIAAGKLAHAALRRFGLGGGTAAPGLVASTLDPAVISRLTAKLSRGSVIVTGTNGKTTTSRLISGMLQQAGLRPIHNRTGSNMMRGLASTVVAAASLDGVLPADIGVWEVDEATLPEAVAATQPRVVVINNLFRDQLDRYGEVNTVAAIWEKALRLLPADSIVVLNADDPRVAHLGAELERRVLYFGIDDPSVALDRVPDAADSIHCLNCSHPLHYEQVYSSHMGRYRCPNCGLARPALDIIASRVNVSTERRIELDVATPAGSLSEHLALPGLYNAYNALAATAAAYALGLEPQVVTAALGSFQAAFGRDERLRIGDKQIALFLVKNPAGFNEVLRTVFAGAGKRDVLILINDLLADGTDVSWLWDVDFEVMQGKVMRATVSGIRAHDMALRLRYAGVVPASGATVIEPSIGQAISQAFSSTPAGQTLYVLPTYTAMLEAKTELARRGWAQRWEDD